MSHPETLLELLRGRAAEVLGARLGLGDATVDRLAEDVATALVVVGSRRLADDDGGIEALVEAADTGILSEVPRALADPANDAEEAVGVLLGGERERVLGLVAERSGAPAAAVATGAAAIAPVVAAWLKDDDRPAAAALAVAADGLSGSAGWLSTGVAAPSGAAATTATTATSATAAASTTGAAGALGARRVAVWGLVLAGALAAGIVGAALGFRGDGSGDDFPAAASSTIDATGEDTAATTETTETTDATETTATETVEPTETTDTTATTDATDTTDTTDTTDAGAAADVAATLVAAGPFTALVDALAQSPGTLAAIAATEPVTVFAPDDAAFAALPASAIPDQAALDGILGYHVVRGVLTPGRLKDGQVLTTLSGRRLTVERKGGVIRVGGAVARPLPRPASGDVVYALKKVLLPPATINAEIGLAPITFESGSDVITPAGRAVLEKAVAYLTATPLRVLIEGHTDADGDEASNLDLSNRRATAVRRYLIAGGVQAALLMTRGFGEARPVASNETDAGKARNRRIAFRVLGPA